MKLKRGKKAEVKRRRTRRRTSSRLTCFLRVSWGLLKETEDMEGFLFVFGETGDGEVPRTLSGNWTGDGTRWLVGE